MPSPETATGGLQGVLCKIEVGREGIALGSDCWDTVVIEGAMAAWRCKDSDQVGLT
jgi:hypothetical protein